MKHMKLTLLLLIVLLGNAKAQSFKDQYAKCAAALHGAGIGDTAYWRLIQTVFACMKGANAPDFTFKTIKGQTVALAQLKGRIVVINFWNTGCKPCIAEMPALNKIVALYKTQNVTFIAATYESAQKAKTFFIKHPFLFQQVTDARKPIVEEFLTNDIYPYSMIIDKAGHVNKIMIGGSFDTNDTFQQFTPAIDECLAQQN